MILEWLYKIRPRWKTNIIIINSDEQILYTFLYPAYNRF